MSAVPDVGPGGLHVPPVVADESEAGHCFHLLFSLPPFFFFLFLRLLLFTHLGGPRKLNFGMPN